MGNQDVIWPGLSKLAYNGVNVCFSVVLVLRCKKKKQMPHISKGIITSLRNPHRTGGWVTTYLLKHLFVGASKSDLCWSMMTPPPYSPCWCVFILMTSWTRVLSCPHIHHCFILLVCEGPMRSDTEPTVFSASYCLLLCLLGPRRWRQLPVLPNIPEFLCVVSSWSCLLTFSNCLQMLHLCRVFFSHNVSFQLTARQYQICTNCSFKRIMLKTTIFTSSFFKIFALLSHFSSSFVDFFFFYSFISFSYFPLFLFPVSFVFQKHA